MISIHNIGYQMRLMRGIRNANKKDDYPIFVKEFMRKYYLEREGGILAGDEENIEDPGKAMLNGYPVWILNAFNSVGIKL